MNLYPIPNLITAIFCTLLGVLVFIKNRRTPSTIAFLGLTMSISIWQIGTFRVLAATDPKVALMWCRFTYWGAVFIPVTTYHLAVVFVQRLRQKKFIIISYLLGWLVFLPLSSLALENVLKQRQLYSQSSLNFS